MGRTYNHVIVIGASLAGLCAARVLSDVSERVTVYERDPLPAGPENRAAVPQGKHVHLLMARGAQEFENLFPGLEMVPPGVVRCADWWPDGPRLKELNVAQRTIAGGIGRKP